MEDYTRCHDDSNEILFSKGHLGKLNLYSGWDLANIFRYGNVCNQIVKQRKKDIENSVKILDVGCSYATFYTFWLEHYCTPGRPRVNYLGLEVRKKVVEKANKLWHNKGVNKINVVEFDAVKERITSLKSTYKYDVILLQEILEHIGKESTNKLIEDSIELLSDDGIIVISSPNPRKKENQEFVWPENHMYEFALEEMLEIVNDYDLVPIQINGWLGKANYMKKKFNNTQKEIYEKLKTISSGFACSIMSHMYPELAICYTIILKKKNDNIEKVEYNESMGDFF